MVSFSNTKSIGQLAIPFEASPSVQLILASPGSLSSFYPLSDWRDAAWPPAKSSDGYLRIHGSPHQADFFFLFC